MKTAYIFVADGFEDIEALGTRDVLKRAGVAVELVSISDDPFVCSSHGVTIGIDNMLECIEIDESDAMIFPGGMPGSRNLAACSELMQLMREHYAQGGLVAAICAAPGLVLSQLEDIKGLTMTCFDGFEKALIDGGAHFVRKAAVSYGQVITGRSAGYSIPFALEIARAMAGDEAVSRAEAGLLLPIEQ